MSKHWRITTSQRRKELVDLLITNLMEYDRRNAKCIHTYPHRSVAEKMADVVVLAEKGQPRLLGPDAHRVSRLARVIENAHHAFDHDHGWRDSYHHDRAAMFVAEAISRAEVKRG